MKPFSQISTLTLIITTLVLSACTETQIPSTSECIPPPVRLEFPVGVTSVPNAKPREIQPLGNWHVVAELPESFIVHNITIRYNNEIWISGSKELYKYLKDSEEWRFYNTIDDVEAVPDGLYLSQDGTLWGIDLNVHHYKDALKDFPLLSRYNESTDRFEFVGDREGILHGYTSSRSPARVDEDQNGLFWMILNVWPEGGYNALYSFDPTTLVAKQHIVSSTESRFSDLEIALDGKIWITDGFTGQLLQYNPFTNEIYPYLGNPISTDSLYGENMRGVSNLYFDRSNRLWVEDRGWLDFSTPGEPIWHRIIRSPVFIRDHGVPENQYGWTRPSSTYQSSNGLFWFTSPVGMVRLDPKKDEWCLFTTGLGSIVEDGDHNLWIAVYNKLYKHSLESRNSQ